VRANGSVFRSENFAIWIPGSAYRMQMK